MSAMDQAFFKAYRQHGPTPGNGDGPVSLVDALEDRPLREANAASAAAKLEGVLDALSTTSLGSVTKPPEDATAKPPAEPADEAPATMDDTPLGAAYNRVPDFLRPVKATKRKKSSPALASAEAKLDLPVLHQGHVGPPAPKSGGRSTDAEQSDEAAAVSMAAESAHSASASAVAEPPAQAPPAQPEGPSQEFLDDLDALADSRATETTLPEDELAPLRPMLQVDCFEWPEVCTKLADRASDTLDELSDALTRMSQTGQKLIGLSAALPEQGVTTLLLTIARQMSLREKRTVLVDAALREPRLASRVGIGPEYGWEDLLDSPMPIEEYLIESIADGLVLMPFCGCIEDEAEVPQLLEPFGTALARLRAHADLVLVDLGTQAHDEPNDPLVLARAVDAVLIVRDARHPVDARQLALHRRLSRAGVVVAGTIETFA